MQNCKVLCKKTNKTLSPGPKLPYVGVFGGGVFSIWRKLLSYLKSKFHVKQQNRFGTKIDVFGCFWAVVLKKHHI